MMWFQLTTHSMDWLAIRTSCSTSCVGLSLANSCLTNLASSSGSCKWRNSFFLLSHSLTDMAGSRLPNFARFGASTPVSGRRRSAALSRRFWLWSCIEFFHGSSPFLANFLTCAGFGGLDSTDRPRLCVESSRCWLCLTSGCALGRRVFALLACGLSGSRHRRRQARQVSMEGVGWSRFHGGAQVVSRKSCWVRNSHLRADAASRDYPGHFVIPNSTGRPLHMYTSQPRHGGRTSLGRRGKRPLCITLSERAEKLCSLF